MKRAFKVICALLALVTLLTCVVACDTKNEKENTTTDNTTTTASTNEDPSTPGSNIQYDENGYELDDLPADLTFGDEDFTILMWEEWAKQDFMLTEGIAWSMELYERQAAVEDRLDVTIKIVQEKGSWNYRKDFIQRVENDLSSASTCSFDLIGSYGASIGGITTKGYSTNLYDVNHLNFDKPWWKQDQIDAATINNKVYFLTGDVTPTSIMTMHCVYGNKELLEDYSYTDLYDWVYDGEWTIEKLMTTALNNIDYGEGASDILGMTICASAQGPLLHGIGVKYIDHDDKGLICVSEDLVNQKVDNFFATVQALYNEYDNVETQTNNSKFSSEKAFFHIGSVGDMINFANNANFEFIVLPMPKYNTEQKEYHTTNGAWNTYYSIPIKTANSDMSGAVLEALASEAHRTLIPVVYEECFSARFVSDPEDAAMVQFIYDALTYDASHVYADDAVGTLHAAFNEVSNATSSWTNVYKSHIDSWKQKILILNNNLK